MTEKEAIERLKYDLAMITFNPMTGDETPLWLLAEDEQGSYNAYECAIKALEEIQQYRAIGTVEECREAVEKLARYEDLEQDGRLLELPCKVGDTVYIINTLLSGKKLIVELEADAFFIALCMMEKRFGKTVFLTQEAAGAALKERSRQ